MSEQVVGKFQKYANFGFLIPDNRDSYGGDFFVNKKNINGAEEGDIVTGHILAKSKGKKPEAKIVQIGEAPKKKVKNVRGIYSAHKGDFGFVDVEGEEKGYFVFKKDINGAKDGDMVDATIKMYKGKPQAVISNILKNKLPLIKGVYKDEGKFGFVVPEKGTYTSDIFIAGAKKMEAKDGSSVMVQIIKESGRRPEGVIKEIF